MEWPHRLNLVCMHFTSASLYLYKFFEPVLFFDPHGSKGKFGHFEGKQKMSKIAKTREAMSIEIGLHAFYVSLYFLKFFELILFLTPMDYSP